MAIEKQGLKHRVTQPLRDKVAKAGYPEMLREILPIQESSSGKVKKRGGTVARINGEEGGVR